MLLRRNAKRQLIEDSVLGSEVFSCKWSIQTKLQEKYCSNSMSAYNIISLIVLLATATGNFAVAGILHRWSCSESTGLYPLC